MVSVLYSRLSDPGSSAGRGHGVVFLGKPRDSHSASPPRYTNLMLGATQPCNGLASHPRKE